MYNGNPFPSDQTLRIDEGSTQGVTANREVRAIVLGPASGATRRSIDARSRRCRFER
jgi:hypothetical protein